MSIRQIRQMNEFVGKIGILAFSIVIFAFSTVNFVNGGIQLDFLVFPQFVVFALIGFFHSHNIWQLSFSVNPDRASFLDLVSHFLMFTAFYNVVLLPNSGLALFEWTILLFAFLSNLVTEICGRKIKNPFMGQPPLFLVSIGIVLFMVKLYIFHFFEANIYQQITWENSTAKALISVFCVVALIFLLMQFKKNITNRVGISEERKTKVMNVFQKICSMFRFLLKNAINLLKTVVSLPVLLVIALCLGLGSLILVLWKVKAVFDDVMKIVEPFLENALSTGENIVTVSTLSSLLDFITVTVVLFYSVYIETKMKNDLDKQIKSQISRVLDFEKYNELPEDIKNQTRNKSKNILCNGTLENRLTFLKSSVSDTVSEVIENQVKLLSN